jgi:predicted MFS family arabinose efflux permease
MADLAVTVLGVAGFLGFLLAGRMDDANASPFDVFAFVWFFTFGGIKCCLPWLLSKRAAAKRDSGSRAVGSALTSWTSPKR